MYLRTIEELLKSNMNLSRPSSDSRLNENFDSDSVWLSFVLENYET